MPQAPKLLSPRDLATAIGSSESSLKRWTDQGKLSVSRTAGGHRRIALTEAIRFVRRNRMPLVQPEILGLPSGLGAGDTPIEETAGTSGEQFCDLLKAGHEIGARNLMLEQFMGGSSIATLADGPIRTAMQVLGESWDSGPEAILVEHRATEICTTIIQELRGLTVANRHRGAALGGAIEGDPYKLPPLITAAVLSECGLQAVNLGADTPLDVLRHAALADDPAERPDLVWVNVSTLTESSRVRHEFTEFAIDCEREGVRMAAGGRAIGDLNLDANLPVVVHEDMRSFHAFLDDTFGDSPTGDR